MNEENKQKMSIWPITKVVKETLDNIHLKYIVFDQTQESTHVDILDITEDNYTEIKFVRLDMTEVAFLRDFLNKNFPEPIN